MSYDFSDNLSRQSGSLLTVSTILTVFTLTQATKIEIGGVQIELAEQRVVGSIISFFIILKLIEFLIDFYREYISIRINSINEIAVFVSTPTSSGPSSVNFLQVAAASFGRAGQSQELEHLASRYERTDRIHLIIKIILPIIISLSAILFTFLYNPDAKEKKSNFILVSRSVEMTSQPFNVGGIQS